MPRPNLLYVMTDQQRFDTIAVLGNSTIHTPNLDRLVRRGLSFVNGYSTCPVCVPARYTIRTGRGEDVARIFSNRRSDPAPGQAATLPERCGPYLAATMRELGYRTWGVGKFHAQPVDEDLGYEIRLRSEEIPFDRSEDAYTAWLAREHPEYDWVDMPHGERTEMYYVPQMSPLPAECTVEKWAADRACEQLAVDDERPYFGFVSFIGPHPPCAPPQPFNRLYDPDAMPAPVKGDPAIDLMDPFLVHMNHLIWADDISELWAKILRARYYGEITYIDRCLGRILDAVEARDDAANTAIVFVSDHGDHLGDHGCWQKEGFYDGAARIPFMVSWPERLPADERRDELVCLQDLFGFATSAAGAPDLRDGCDLLAVSEGRAEGRDHLLFVHGEPGERMFKCGVRRGKWKYIFFSNGGGEQLFDLDEDPWETRLANDRAPEVLAELRRVAVADLGRPGFHGALDGDDLRVHDYASLPRRRLKQFPKSRGVTDFQSPEEALADLGW